MDVCTCPQEVFNPLRKKLCKRCRRPRKSTSLRTVKIRPGFHVHPDEVLPVAIASPNKPFTYRVNDKKTFVAYAPGPIEALELFEAANLGVTLDITNVHEETPESMRAW
jgi:hypothetical protein